MALHTPAFHRATLTTIPLELTSSKSRQSIKHIGSVRCKMSRIFKKMLNSDTAIRSEIKEPLQLPKPNIHLSETTADNNDTNTSTLVENPENDKSSNNLEPFERLPFTEPCFSLSSNDENVPVELSTYHKHCIHQEKHMDKNQYHHEALSAKQTTCSQLNSSKSVPIKEKCPDLVNYRLQNANKPTDQITVNNKRNNSTAALPVSSSVENRIGLQYASRKNTITNSQSLRSFYAPQYLRRLRSKPKIRQILNETKTSTLTSKNQSSPLSSVSSSIAHRIELLKQAMHNNQLEFHQSKLDKISPIDLSSHPLMHKLNKETQTNANDKHLNSPECHHIHHHHIHSSSLLPIEWRTHFSIIGTLSIIFLLLIELITVIF
ncbi:unnamed protein product [Rotaria socialis]|uniref:Uncharacterized protein n=1 Tax=Rotaria socialis TaxID=392032 RepID=A0A817YKW9_9BILA|nr:unnamed protein product [Rotaria socialis]CAF4774638.1 unnamed protein product [Rotaria socialis]